MAPEFIDIEKVCRLCLREDDGRCKMTSMYQQPELDYLIQKCVQIEVVLGSYEPTNICASCMLSLDSWSKFKELCDSANCFLQQFIQQKTSSDLEFNSEISNLGTLGFTPSQMSDLSVGFFENDALWNNCISQQQWNEVIDPLCTDLPIPKYMKKVQPPDDLVFDTMSDEECINMALNELSESDNNVTNTKTHWWNPKAISMKTYEKQNDKPAYIKGTSKSLCKYNRYDRKTFFCNICPEKYTKFNELLIHDSTVHHDITKNFSCKNCGKLFLTKGRLEVHEKIHREKLFECQLCQKKFLVKKTLDNHLNTHIGLYICQKCGYRAHNMRNLKIHENTHSVIKNYCCNECGKRFAILSSLRRHNRLVHQKSDLYRCDQCDYSTIQPSNLKHHKTTHIAQKFICDHCGSWFKTNDLLLKHSKSHKDAQFNCSQCTKIFKRKESLKNHVIKCHQVGPTVKKYKCDRCEKCFMNNRNLRHHINRKVCVYV